MSALYTDRVVSMFAVGGVEGGFVDKAEIRDEVEING